MAQQSHADDELLDMITAPTSLDEDEVRGFVREALDEIRSHLEDNHHDGQEMGLSMAATVDDVLSTDMVHEIQVRAEPLENPKVTVWLSDTPIWANDSWRETIYPKGLNAYNGKVTTTFDVRPF